MGNNDAISQDEIDSLISGLDLEDLGSGGGTGTATSGAVGLTREEKDTIIELSNINMGASAATLSVIFNQEVSLKTPDLKEFIGISEFQEPKPGEEKVLAKIAYTKGLKNTSVFLIGSAEVKLIASHMMGEAMTEIGVPLTPMELDAITEVMNQMTKATATNLGSMLSKTVDVGPPQVTDYSTDNLIKLLPELTHELFFQVDYMFEMEDGTPFQMSQIITRSNTTSQIDTLLKVEPDTTTSIPGATQPKPSGGNPGASGGGNSQQQYQQGPGAGGYGNPGMGPPQGRNGDPNPMQSNPVTVQSVQFPAFDNQPAFYGEHNKNLELVMDVSLSLTVELGKTEISIKEVLELTRGSVIE
ncbi:MAG: chemotaxis protein CheC, partial [Cyanobacteria bacterium]|nr:chemotaxis protein CheC [Cyanobacteriota bacterium]